MTSKTGLSRVLMFAASFGVAVSAQAADPPITISTGKSGGGYNTIGERLKGVLVEQDLSAQVLTSAGSIENLTRLADPQSPVNVGLTQADALQYYLKEHPGFADQFISLGEIGKECVFIVTGKDSEIKSDSDLQQKGKNWLIAVQSPNSGVAVTWEYMALLEPAFKNTAPAFVDGAEALLQIKSGGKSSKIQAAMVVQKPMAKSTEMQVVLENPKDFRLIPVKDWDLNDKLPDGSAVYTFENVTVAEKKWGFDTAVDTICTRGLMLANKTKLTADQRTRLAKVMLLAASRVVGESGK
ncbi:MAG TPA: TAXI family TRAP transporter solute-binding subunit [Candidatus Competibacteraceae bacterium]|nr:TAXI family TRAP transporter solute-binding subunit [Candidatus Competibacteraceae bacterium]HRZ05177.1 TAXI family TRAP transporter solute-binding subunit [Candidatus Competibacteraceae bacterium]HSA46823.1 TAXI family TRAP transporter solute-binding subunit [Candidatus Competibacteraceae bacterium]